MKYLSNKWALSRQQVTKQAGAEVQVGPVSTESKLGLTKETSVSLAQQIQGPSFCISISPNPGAPGTQSRPH